MNLRHTTLETARRWIAQPLGLDLNREVDEITEAVHDIRSVLYSLFPQVPIEVHMQKCMTLERFPLECQNCSSKCYWGFTLPRDADQVLQIRFNDKPIRLRNGWVSPSGCESEVGKFDILQSQASERPHTPWNCPQHYSLISTTQEDQGLDVSMHYVDSAGEEREEVGTLTDGCFRSTYPVAELKGVMLPDRKGKIYLNQEDGKILSTYHRWEIVPEYRRVRIDRLSGSTKVLWITYAKRLIPLDQPQDAVEVDNAMVWKHLAQYIKLNSRTALEGKERNEAEIHYAKAIDLMKGMHRRAWGGDEAVLRKVPQMRRRSGLVSKG